MNHKLAILNTQHDQHNDFTLVHPMWANQTWNWSLLFSFSMDITILHAYRNTINTMAIQSRTTRRNNLRTTTILE